MKNQGCSIICTKIVIFFVVFTLTFSFFIAALDWALLERRTSLQSVRPATKPHFLEVTTNPSTEGYYKLWRYYDLHVDKYRLPRQSGFPAVPIIYVHGNGGSFMDMEFFGRSIGESNVKQRYRQISRFQEDIKRKLFLLYKHSGDKMPGEGEEIPKDLQRKAEEMVIAETPLLGTELFAVDFLEESNVQSGVVMVKEARFLNYSAHLLWRGFLVYYEEALSQAEESLRKERKGEENSSLPLTVRDVESEYLNSLCGHPDLPTDEPSTVCSVAKEHIREFSSLERIRREVERVRREGIWVWTESLGSNIALFAAVLYPEMYAGLVMAGPPIRYPPLLFDTSCIDYQRVIHDASIASYAYNYTDNQNWNELLDIKDSLQLLWNLRKVSSQEITSRISRVRMISINGGVLDDIVPSRSSLLMRSTGRSIHSEDHKKMMKMTPFHVERRDVCTEELRGCGIPLSHRGLVYALQFLDVAADSLVWAALTSDSSKKLFGAESTNAMRDRLFPMVVESFPRSLDDYRRDEFLFVNSLATRRREQNGHEVYYEKKNINSSLIEMHKVCVTGKTTLNLQEIPIEEDEDKESWEALHLFIGSTTYAAEDVHLPELSFVHVNKSDTSSLDNVYTRVATKLHLPNIRNDSAPEVGSVFRTVISFQVLQKQRGDLPKWVQPRFCFLISPGKLSRNNFSFVQYDKIDPWGRVATPTDKSHDDNGDDGRVFSPRKDQLFVEKYGRFVLVHNLDSVSLETNMTIQVKNRVVFPHVLCGSLRSFRLAFRGTENLALDEPEPQQQYFFGPYEATRHTFHYSWRPFFTSPFNLTNVYVVYVLSAEENPNITLMDLELEKSPRWSQPHYWAWRFERWTTRWMAVLSAYSVSGKFAGCYALVFCTLFTCFHTPRFIGQNIPSKKRYVKLGGVAPSILILVFGLLFEFLSDTLTRTALTVCLREDTPIRSDEELTAMMSASEKMVLMFLYVLPPRYEACKYSWIRMQSILPSHVQIEHMVHMALTFSFSIILLLIELATWCSMWPLSFLVHMVLKFRSSSYVPLWRLIALWSISIIAHALIPGIHISIITTLACCLSFATLWCIPHASCTANGANYRWLCFLLIMMLHLTAHFEGLVLVVRNYIIVPRVVWQDKERLKILPEHSIAVAVVQGGLAVVYGTVYFSFRHSASMDAMRMKKNEEKQKNKEKKENKSSSNLHELDEYDDKFSYFLGDIGRRHPLMSSALKIFARVTIFLAMWVSLISLRRPLEGPIALLGLCLTAVFLATVLVRLW